MLRWDADRDAHHRKVKQTEKLQTQSLTETHSATEIQSQTETGGSQSQTQFAVFSKPSLHGDESEKEVEEEEEEEELDDDEQRKDREKRDIKDVVLRNCSLLETVLESVPQAVLQSYILVTEVHMYVLVTLVMDALFNHMQISL